MTNQTLRFLLIRRDNIGDLVCTTPLFAALRARFPLARIEALVNSYNAPVLEGNPDLNAVHAYTKAKHRSSAQSVLGVYWERARLLRALREPTIDYLILAAPRFQPRSLRLARQLRPKHIVGFTEPGIACKGIDMAIPYSKPRPLHADVEARPCVEPQ